ncbi:MAG TPA: hypothetical protein VGC56_12570 [Allosphingosinicella sp.]|jgi:hypothetical protein
MNARAAAATALLLTLTGGCRSDPVLSPQSAADRAAYESRREARRLAQAGFEPLAALAARSIEVQRVDPTWNLIDYPSVELTRDAQGNAAIALKYLGHVESRRVPAALWDRLSARIPAAFRPADPQAEGRSDRAAVRRGQYCHAWHSLEALSGGRLYRIIATPCMANLQKETLAYTDLLIRAAIDALPLCAPERAVPETDEALAACGHRLGPPTEAFRNYPW